MPGMKLLMTVITKSSS